MARFTLLLVVVALASAHSLHLENLNIAQREQFAKFVVNFGKNYKSAEEYETRFKIFQDNLAKIEQLNANKLDTAVYGINRFADLTKEEFNFYLGYRSKNLSHLEHAQIPKVHAPDSFDWRSKGVVQEIKDQQQCGSCWAFSAVSNIESVYAIQSGNLLSLSEQQIVDCDQNDDGCNGGDMASAINAVISEGGLELESDYPYTAKDGQCHLQKNLLHAQPSSVKRIGNIIFGANEDDMRDYVAATSPLSIAINADLLQLYNSGIIQPKAGSCSASGLDHGVNIVGYGTSNGTPYWIIRNSWGKGWGESGYFRIIRGTGACGLNMNVVAAVF